MRRWCRKHAPWLTDAELDQIVRETETRDKRWTHDQSATVLEIGVRDREVLGLWFFGANDDPDYERRQELKRAKDAARKRKSRAAHSNGRPRGRPPLDLSPEEMAARKREQANERQRRRRASRKKPSRDIKNIGPVTHLSVTTPGVVMKSAERPQRDGADHQPIEFESVKLAPEIGGSALAAPPPSNDQNFPDGRRRYSPRMRSAPGGFPAIPERKNEMSVVKFPGEYLTKEDRERERWLGTAFCAVAIADLSAEDRQEFLAELLRTRFSDVPGEKPTSRDDPAWPAYAVRFLLEVLTDKTGHFAEVGRMAKDKVFRDLGLFQDGTWPPDES